MTDLDCDLHLSRAEDAHTDHRTAICPRCEDECDPLDLERGVQCAACDEVDRIAKSEKDERRNLQFQRYHCRFASHRIVARRIPAGALRYPEWIRRTRVWA